MLLILILMVNYCFIIIKLGKKKMENNTALMPFKIEILSLSKKVAYCKTGNWVQRQKLKFTIFLDYNKHLFTQEFNKKSVKIFLVMSRFIKTRTASQCRSHHQKAQMYYKSVQNLIRVQTARFGVKKYKMMSKIYQSQLQQINHSSYDISLQQSLLSKKQSKSKQKSEIIDGKSSKLLDISQQFEDEIVEVVKREQLENQYCLPEPTLFEFPVPHNKSGQMVLSYQVCPGWSLQEQQAYYYRSIYSNSTQGSFHNDVHIGESEDKMKIIQRCNYHFYLWLQATLQLENFSFIQKSVFN